MSVRPHNTAGHVRATHLGKMLALYRTALGWSLRDMAKVIGTSPATLSRIERNYAMDADTLLRLLNWLMADAPEVPHASR